MRWLYSTTESMDTNLSKLIPDEPGRLQSMGSQRVGQDLSTEQQQQQQMAIVLRLGNSNIKGLKDDRVYLMLKLQITCKNLISLGL